MAGSVVNTVTEKFLKIEWHKNEQCKSVNISQ